jgi:hypothetical protein
MPYEKFSDRFRALPDQAMATPRATPTQMSRAYDKFSDRFKNERGRVYPTKVANSAKAEPQGSVFTEPQNRQIETTDQPASTLATLATLAGGYPSASLFEARATTDPKEWHNGVRRLDIDHPPKGVPAHRGQTFVSDATRFLAGPFAEQAASLGWTALDLFGCDDTRPLARLDQAGLLWLLNGSRLVALSAATAVIRTHTGARHTWQRRPSGPGRVLAWELV